MDWTIVNVIVVAIAIALPLWQLQRKTKRRDTESPQPLEQPAEPGSEGLNVTTAGEVAPGPDESSR